MLNDAQTCIADSWYEKVHDLMLESLKAWKNAPNGLLKINEMREFVFDEMMPTIIQNEDVYLSLSKMLNISSQELGSSQLAASIFDPRLGASIPPTEKVRTIRQCTLTAAQRALSDFSHTSDSHSNQYLNKK